MHIFETIVIKSSRVLDLLAGVILAGTALLVVANIIGRTLLNLSILGTYEMVGFLTAAVVGLSLARCAVENSHIAIEFILERAVSRYHKMQVISLFYKLTRGLYQILVPLYLNEPAHRTYHGRCGAYAHLLFKIPPAVLSRLHSAEIKSAGDNGILPGGTYPEP